METTEHTRTRLSSTYNIVDTYPTALETGEPVDPVTYHIHRGCRHRAATATSSSTTVTRILSISVSTNLPLAMDVVWCIFLFLLALLFLFYLGHRRHNPRTPNRDSAIPTSYDREMTGLPSRNGHEQNPQFSTFTDGEPHSDSSMQRTYDKVDTSSSEGKLWYLWDRSPSPPPSGPDSLEETHGPAHRSLPLLTRWSSKDSSPAVPPSPPILRPSILKRPTSPLTISPPSGMSSGWLQRIGRNFYSSATQDSVPMCAGAKAEGQRKGVRFGEDQIKEIERVPEELRTRPKREAILLGMGKV